MGTSFLQSQSGEVSWCVLFHSLSKHVVLGCILRAEKGGGNSLFSSFFLLSLFLLTKLQHEGQGGGLSWSREKPEWK